tara:strand:+ start:4508 stop:4912 length:405 start_codon:yes stop_codon:yes gene_type:complete
MGATKNKTVQDKKKMLIALEKTLGIVTTACKKTGVSRTQYYIWLNEDKEFKKQVDAVEGIAIDFAESKLLENIKEQKETSIIFYLKTKGKKRGYIEKQEIDHTTKGESINLGGTTTAELIARADALKKLDESES